MSGCLPSHAAFLRVPVVPPGTEPPDGSTVLPADAPLLVDVPLAALRAAMPEFELTTATFYYRGRVPLPFELRAQQADAAAATVRLVLPPPHDTEPWVVVVCPGGAGATRVPDADLVRRSQPARLDFTRAQR